MVDTLSKELEMTVEFVSWQMPANAVVSPKPDNYKQEGTQYVLQLAHSLNVPITFQAPTTATRAAHEATKIAFQMELGFAFSRAVFDLKWIEGKDISNAELLIDTAERLGADRDEFRSAFMSKQGNEAVDSDFERCADNRIWTIPSFVAHGKVIQIHHFKDMPSIDQLKNFILAGEWFIE